MKSLIKIINNICILSIVVIVFSIFGCNSNSAVNNADKKKSDLGAPLPLEEQAKAKAYNDAQRDAYMKRNGIKPQ